jgi:hypothetical protein
LLVPNVIPPSPPFLFHPCSLCPPCSTDLCQ